MSHFYGVLKGSRGEVTRTATKSSGCEAKVAGWKGGIRAVVFQDAAGRDCYRVERIAWRGHGEYALLAEGVFE